MSSTSPEIVIAPFEPADHPQVIELITTIQQQEFGIPITYAGQPDLHDIPAYYRGAGHGEFWVARAAGRVVGTIALVDIGNRQGALRKMFVARDWRGATLGVGDRLLRALIREAAARGIDSLFLGTTTRFAAAHRFYRKNGFVEIAGDDLPPAFPRMTVDTMFFRRSGLIDAMRLLSPHAEVGSKP